jgi:hypothetical protein
MAKKVSNKAPVSEDCEWQQQKKRKHFVAPQVDASAAGSSKQHEQALPYNPQKNKQPSAPAKTVFDPFKKFPVSELKWNPKDPKAFLLWIKDSTFKERTSLQNENKCWLCKQQGHQIAACPAKEALHPLHPPNCNPGAQRHHPTPPHTPYPPHHFHPHHTTPAPT